MFIFHKAKCGHLKKKGKSKQFKPRSLLLLLLLLFRRFDKKFTNVLCFRNTNVIQTKFDIQNNIWGN